MDSNNIYKTYESALGMTVGDHVEKVPKEGHQTRFVGRLLSIYAVPHEHRLWCVVLLDKNEASDHLQHLYPLELFRKID